MAGDLPHNPAIKEGSPPRGYSIPLDIGKRRFNQSYGLLVGWLKLLLPTVALVLVIIAVFWAYFEDEGKIITDTLTRANDLVSEHLEVSQAKYTGLSDDGQRYTITAETVQQETVDAPHVLFVQPRADIHLDNGSWALVSANRGSLDRENQVLELTEAVNLFHDLGYEFRTESATLDLAAGSAYGFDPVEGQGPFGYVEADGFQIIDRGEIVQLTGKARIVIHDTHEP
jgi:lipopolysaccharide export system protein LptC